MDDILLYIVTIIHYSTFVSVPLKAPNCCDVPLLCKNLTLTSSILKEVKMSLLIICHVFSVSIHIDVSVVSKCHMCVKWRCDLLLVIIIVYDCTLLELVFLLCVITVWQVVIIRYNHVMSRFLLFETLMLLWYHFHVTWRCCVLSCRISISWFLMIIVNGTSIDCLMNVNIDQLKETSICWYRKYDVMYSVTMCVTTMGFIFVTPRVRRATKAPLDGTARFRVCVCVETTVVTTKVKTTLVNWITANNYTKQTMSDSTINLQVLCNTITEKYRN